MKDELLGELQRDLDESRITKAQFDSLSADIISKCDQREKLLSDFQAGKMDQQQLESWMDATSTDLRKIHEAKEHLIDINIEKRRKRNVRKVTWPLLVPIVLAMFGFGVYKVWCNIYAKRCIANIPEPVQTDVESSVVGKEYDAKAINGRIYHIKMEYLARYDIKGLVVATYDYYDGKTAYDMAFPRDLSLSWGKMAEHNNLIEYKHGNRKLSASIGINAPLSREDTNQCSNNHLTTDNEEVLKKIRKVRTGDYVELKGYLIKANISSDVGNFELSSSLTRDDHMDSAFDASNTGCEVFYVEEIYWLNDDGSIKK